MPLIGSRYRHFRRLAVCAGPLIGLLLLALVVDPSTASAGSGSISGRAFVDLNNNGSFDGSDAPLAGWNVVAANERFNTSVTTNESGGYLLENLPADVLTLRLDAFSGCIDLFNYNWLGEYIVGFCAENSLPSRSVNVSEGETVAANLVVHPFPGDINGRLWLKGAPADPRTELTVKVGGNVCATGSVTHEIQGAALVSSFRIAIPPTCAGDDLKVYIGSTQLYEAPWVEFWRGELKDWVYEGDPFTTLDLADSQFQMVFGSVSEPPKPSTLVSSVIHDQLCGQVQTTTSGPVHFGGLAVLGDETKPGCGRFGDTVKFCLDGKSANGGLIWNYTVERITLDPESSLCPSPVVPDADCSGNADAFDGLSILRFLATLGPLPACFDRSDANCNHVADTPDVLATLRFASGIVTHSPRLDC